MPNLIINDTDLYYEVHGKGIPLLLVAGLASDSQSWQPIINNLSKHYQVITFDNRGSGRTKPLEVELSIQDIADDCIALAQHLKLPTINLLGHSMGGFVALDCAIRYPEYISHLILAGTSAFNSERNNALFHDWVSYTESGMNPKQWFRNIFYWIFSTQFFENEEALNGAIQFAIDYPYPQTALAFKNQIHAIKAFNCTDALSDITSKTLILCGAEDLLFPSEESIDTLSAIPNSYFTVIEHAAHSIHMENPSKFMALIQEFLAI